MKRRELRSEVERAIEAEWEGFSRRHPQLAQVLDQDMLMEQAMENLGSDPAFNAAMNEAQVAGASAQAVCDLIRQFIQQWLRQLL